jgi:hypothetical protein
VTAACVAVQDQNGDGELDTAECVNHFVGGTPAQRSAQAQKVSHPQQRSSHIFSGAWLRRLLTLRCHVFVATCSLLPRVCRRIARQLPGFRTPKATRPLIDPVRPTKPSRRRRPPTRLSTYPVVCLSVA